MKSVFLGLFMLTFLCIGDAEARHLRHHRSVRSGNIQRKVVRTIRHPVKVVRTTIQSCVGGICHR